MNSRPFRVGAVCAPLLSMLLLLTTIPIAAGCGGSRRPVRNSFYYWRSTFTLDAESVRYLREMSVERLYVRFFDVGWHEASSQPYPIAPVVFRSEVPEGTAVIPTVFIKNDVLRRLETGDLWQLATRIRARIEHTLESIRGIDPRDVDEIQIDCDWTASTRDIYFELLQRIRERAAEKEWRTMATIRLHQIKFRHNTGVPPVERGMLMAYNVGQPDAVEERNAIFSRREVLQYLGRLEEYPIPLDVALPLFSWGVVFRGESFVALLGNLRRGDLAGGVALRNAGGNWYDVTAEHYLGGEHLFPGDRIRLEEVDPEECASVARTIAAKAGHDSMSVALFHFDPTIVKNHDRSQIQNLYGAFH